MNIHPAEQGSDAWRDARGSVVTASCMTKVMSKGRGSAPSLTRRGYMVQLATEIITGKPVLEGFVSKWMSVGIEREEESRQFYAMIAKVEVEQVGLIYLNKKKRIGASVDGLVGDEGLVEIKCPILLTHIDYLLRDKLPAAYTKQVQAQLWITDRWWCDFVSYHPEAHKMMFCKRVYRDEEYIKDMKKATYEFIAETDILVEKLRAM